MSGDQPAAEQQEGEWDRRPTRPRAQSTGETPTTAAKAPLRRGATGGFARTGSSGGFERQGSSGGFVRSGSNPRSDAFGRVESRPTSGSFRRAGSGVRTGGRAAVMSGSNPRIRTGQFSGASPAVAPEQAKSSRWKALPAKVEETTSIEEAAQAAVIDESEHVSLASLPASDGVRKVVKTMLHARVRTEALAEQKAVALFRECELAITAMRAFGLLVHDIHSYPKGSVRIQEAAERLQEAMKPYLETHGSLILTLNVDRACIHHDLPVYLGREDELFPFFEFVRDGVHRIVIQPDATPVELVDLARLVFESWRIRASDLQRDAVTIFWERAFEHIEFQEVDISMDARWGLAENQEFQLVERESINHILSACETPAVPASLGGYEMVREDPDYMHELGLEPRQVEAMLRTQDATFREAIQIPDEGLRALWDRWYDLEELAQRKYQVLLRLLRLGGFDVAERSVDHIVDILVWTENDVEVELAQRVMRSVRDEAARAHEDRAKFFERIVERVSQPRNCGRFIEAIIDFEDDERYAAGVAFLASLLPEPVVAAAVAALDRHPDRTEQERLVAIIARTGLTRTEQLLELLFEARGSQASGIIEAFVRMGERAEVALARATKHNNSVVRVQALKGLHGKFTDERRVRQFLVPLIDSTESEVRAAAIRELERVPEGIAVEVLGEQLQRSGFSTRPKDEMITICRMLGRAAGPRAVDTLREFARPRLMHVHKGSIDLQIAAMMGLAETGAEEVRDLLEEVADSFLAHKSAKIAARSALRRYERSQAEDEEALDG